MTDSSNNESEGFIVFITRLSSVLRDYFNAKREQAALRLEYKKESDKLIERYEGLLKPHADLEAELKAVLIGMIWPNKAMLISKTRKSFITPYGIVQFKAKPESVKVVDPDGVQSQARKDRLMNELFDLTRIWKLKISVFERKMKTEPHFAKRYKQYVQVVGGADELLVKPTDRFTERFDNERLTPKSTNLGPEPDVKDESPDA